MNIGKRQLVALISVLFKEIVREPAVLFWGIVFPILMSWTLGIAFSQKHEVIRNVAIIADQNIQRNSKIIQRLNDLRAEKLKPARDQEMYRLAVETPNLGRTVYTFMQTGKDNAFILLKRGNVTVILEESDEKILYHFDPLNSEAQLTYREVGAIFNRNFNFFQKTADDVRILTLKGTRYIDFLIPGLISMGIMMSCMWGISYSIIDKRSKKLLRRMIATPMKKSNFLVALMIARLTMNIVESSLLFLFAYLYFKTEIQGDIFALFAVFLAGNLCFSGLAVFVSSRTSNTEIGNGLINLVVTPMMVLSGIFFSYHNFPEWGVGIIQKMPLTMMADSVRSIFNEGAGFISILPEVAIMTFAGMFFFIFGLKIFKWY